MKYCKWTYQDIEDFYTTSCHQGQVFIDGDVEDNRYIFCPYCGKKIKENKNDTSGI